MKIKVKVKTLIFMLFIFAVIFSWGIPASILGIANYLDRKNSDKALMFYEKYASYPTTSSIEGNFVYANKLVKGFDRFTIFLDGWGGTNQSSRDIEKAEKILEDIVNSTYKKTEKQYFIDSYKMLMDIAIATGDSEMLNDWILFGQNYNDKKIKYISDIYNGFLMHVNNDNEKATKIISEYEDTEYADVKLYVLKMEVALFEEDYDEAMRLSEKIKSLNWETRDKLVFGTSRYYERGYWLNSFYKTIKGENKVKGTVTYEGKPMPFVEIYVQNAERGFRSGGESYIGITDENGRFQTIKLKDGIYSIGIGLDNSLLEDRVLSRSGYKYVTLDGQDEKVDFVFNDTINMISPSPGEKISGNEFTVSWEKVENADHYTVQVVVFSNPYEKNGSSITTPILDKNGKDKFTETYAVFDINKMKSEPSGFSYAGDEMLLGYDGVLGRFLPGIEYPITVNACDKDGKVITSSLPMRTYYDKISSITTEGSLDEGEKLILDKKYIEAIDYYENILKNEPSDIDALMYLIKIYGIGWKKGERNIDRAIELSFRYTDITGDSNLIFRVLDTMGRDEIKENKDKIYSLQKETNVNIGIEGYRLLSRCYIDDENWEGARESLMKIDEYVPDSLFYLNLYFGNYDEAAENLKRLYTSELTTEKIIKSVLALHDTKLAESDKKIFSSFLLKLVKGVDHNEGKSLYNKTVNQIKDNNIKSILYGIYLERRWDVTY